MENRITEGKKAATGPASSPALQGFTEKIDDFLIMSTMSMSLLRELSSSEMSGKQLAHKISRDPTLSASVLKLANSAYYGVPNRISTVSHAVSLIGLVAVKSLVQGVCLVEFSQPDTSIKGDLEGRDFAAHSMAVSKMAGVLARKFKFPMLGQGEAETAGLLHDMGFLLLSTEAPNEFRTIVSEYKKRLKQCAGDPSSEPRIRDIEQRHFGFDHAELGAWLARKWNLPGMIMDALRYHHGSIDQCINKESATVIQIANLICNEHGMTYMAEGCWGEVDESVLTFIRTQNKEELYDDLPASVYNEIERTRFLYDYICAGEGASMMGPAPLVSNADPEPERPIYPKEPEPVSTGSEVPVWTYLVSGAPQILRGETGSGVAMLSSFLIGVALFAVLTSGGSPSQGIAFLVLAGLSWIASVLRT